MKLFWLGLIDERNTTMFVFAEDRDQSEKKFIDDYKKEPDYIMELNAIFENAHAEYRIKIVKEGSDEN